MTSTVHTRIALLALATVCAIPCATIAAQHDAHGAQSTGFHSHALWNGLVHELRCSRSEARVSTWTRVTAQFRISQRSECVSRSADARSRLRDGILGRGNDVQPRRLARAGLGCGARGARSARSDTSRTPGQGENTTREGLSPDRRRPLLRAGHKDGQRFGVCRRGWAIGEALPRRRRRATVPRARASLALSTHRLDLPSRGRHRGEGDARSSATPWRLALRHSRLRRPRPMRAWDSPPRARTRRLRPTRRTHNT